MAFYERAGFVPEGPVFEECRIQHRQMRWTLKETS
jgi:predicted GNAT family N-acyltransferase